MMVRAPGLVTLDERRISVIALRADAFITSVEDVTTGAAIKAGDPLAILVESVIHNRLRLDLCHGTDGR